MTKHHRPSRFDRFTHPDASPADTINWHVCASFDEACRAMDRKWGVDRLPSLVPVEMAERYGRALAALNEAIRAGDTEATRQNADNCARGLAKLDEAAEAAGKPKSDPRVMELSDGGQFKFGIIEDDRDWPALKAARPDLMFFTKREVVNAMKAYHNNLPAIEAVKAVFPDAKLSKINVGQMVDDQIPY